MSDQKHPSPRVLLLLVLGFFGAWAAILPGPSPLAAQEFRVTGTGGFSAVPVLSSSLGSGAGIRLFPTRRFGFGVERDRWSFSERVVAPLCPVGLPCTYEERQLESELEIWSYLLLGELAKTENWRLRLLVGRSAGSLRGAGENLESGTPLNPPPASTDPGFPAWSRGSDGSVVGFETLRALPGVGFLRPSILVAYRHHQTDMEGCVPGAYSPYCGLLSFNEVQFGLFFSFWAR